MEDLEVCADCWHEECVCAVPVTERILKQLRGEA